MRAQRRLRLRIGVDVRRREIVLAAQLQAVSTAALQGIDGRVECKLGRFGRQVVRENRRGSVVFARGLQIQVKRIQRIRQRLDVVSLLGQQCVAELFGGAALGAARGLEGPARIQHVSGAEQAGAAVGVILGEVAGDLHDLGRQLHVARLVEPLLDAPEEQVVHALRRISRQQHCQLRGTGKRILVAEPAQPVFAVLGVVLHRQRLAVDPAPDLIPPPTLLRQRIEQSFDQDLQLRIDAGRELDLLGADLPDTQGVRNAVKRPRAGPTLQQRDPEGEVIDFGIDRRVGLMPEGRQLRGRILLGAVRLDDGLDLAGLHETGDAEVRQHDLVEGVVAQQDILRLQILIDHTDGGMQMLQARKDRLGELAQAARIADRSGTA